MKLKWSKSPLFKVISEKIDGSYVDPTCGASITGTPNIFKIFVHDCDAHKNNTSNFNDAVLEFITKQMLRNQISEKLQKHFLKYLARDCKWTAETNWTLLNI